MPNSIKNTMSQITSFWTKLTKRKRTSIVVLTLIIISIAIVVTLMINKVDYVELYSNLDSNEAGEIYNNLVKDGYQVKVSDNGTILVNSDDEGEIRMSLAAEGYPKSTLNYDIFEKSTAFGTTEYQKKVYMQLQLQDRIQDTIKSIDCVDDAIVTLMIPDNEAVVLKSDKKDTTASVLLKIKNNQAISANQVDAIIALVSKSVSGLTADNIAVVDSNMQVLNRSSSEGGSINTGTQLELEQQVGNTLKTQILNMLEPVLGYNKVLATVNVKLDFEKKSSEVITFSPVLDDEGIAVSLSEIKEITKTGDTASGSSSEDTNDDGTAVYVAGDTADSEYSNISRTVDYEVNKTIESIETAQGEIKEMSVSVILDIDKNNNELITQVKKIVSGAIGIDENLIVVEAMSFNGTSDMTDIFVSSQLANEALLKEQQKKNTVIYISIGAAVVVLLFILSRIAKIKRKNSVSQDEMSSRRSDGVYYTPSGNDDYEEDDGSGVPDIKVNSNKKTYKEQIEKFYKNNPAIVLQLIKNWMNED